MQTAAPLELRLLAVLPGRYSAEAALHARFAHARRRGEWFDATPDILSFLAERVAEAAS